MPKETVTSSPDTKPQVTFDALCRQIGIPEYLWHQWEDDACKRNFSLEPRLLVEMYLDETVSTIQKELGMPAAVWHERMRTYGPMLIDFYNYRRQITPSGGSLPEENRKTLREAFVGRWSQADRQRISPIFQKMSQYVGSNKSIKALEAAQRSR